MKMDVRKINKSLKKIKQNNVPPSFLLMLLSSPTVPIVRQRALYKNKRSEDPTPEQLNEWNEGGQGKSLWKICKWCRDDKEENCFYIPFKDKMNLERDEIVKLFFDKTMWCELCDGSLFYFKNKHIRK
ncbi:hypothetical protein [Diatraea saccharalis granulovirus]|uniref:Uncharacterized protein n=1 Tax=Diatraea saccharalis granulovirus TaxID=1675862 RepID=A0A0R7EYQ6_9BBAC|nr:hypothetical protein [Diatraea saccharalis granulovirus]AKN80721.1 hypothetical protein [Diatraea saccharalis granulovirus]